ncbi:MAG: MASE4 domain-containing protein [Proteobacteria bacterium]|nr:MASE4 domain-containing protein [Pseudomonadota bacterium]
MTEAAAASDSIAGMSGRTLFLSLLPSSEGGRRFAAGLVVLLVAVFLVLVPFTKLPLAPSPAFIPAYQAALFVSDLTTAAVLFGQFSVQRTRGLLVLAVAYLFTAGAIVPHTLSFPGLFPATGTIGAGPQTTVWLYMLWHAGFPLMVMVYANVKADERAMPNATAVAWLAAAATIGLVVAGTVMTTAGHALLPTLLRPDNSYTATMTVVVFGVWGLNFVALLLLAMRRPYKTIDLWMMVVVVAWIGDVGLSAALNAKRFDLGFYAGRGYGLIAAVFVLGMLLLETRRLYARVANDLVSERDSAERQSRRVFETSQDIILITDTFGRIKQVSPSSTRILGYRPEEMIGHIGKDFIFPEDLEATRREMRAARVGNAMRNFRCRYVHKDGRPISLIWTGVCSAVDRQHFFIGRDVTDVEAKEDQLRQSQKMEAVGQLTGGVAHDFNNILMVILANVEELLEADTLQPDQREQLNSIAASGQRAAELTRRLLAFSRKQRLMPQPTNMNDLVSGTDKMLRRSLGEQIEIEAILDDALWTTNVDRAQLEAALVNLCVNARDAMPDGGRLLIETANQELDEVYAADNPEVVPGEYAMLAVSDTGAGMPPEVLKKVFEPFFTTKGVGKGTGLGLSMVYGFIKQSSGHIKIYSEVGRGTTIRMYMPRSDMPAEQAARVAPVLPRGDERILMVEDDDQVRTAVLNQLRGLGYAVREAAGAQQALELLERGETFDLMLTDVIMPGIDGPSLAKKVGERWPDLKVIFMSGYSENAARHHGRVAADAHILAKPFRKIDLALRVREVLDRA